jgi:hypothetical protein
MFIGVVDIGFVDIGFVDTGFVAEGDACASVVSSVVSWVTPSR